MTGGGLVTKARGVDPRELMGEAGEQISPAESRAFRTAATDNLLPSIDAMLEHRTDLVKVGKRVIATLLYQQEAAAGPQSFDEDWMSLIFSYMAEGAKTLDAFAQNPVSFVTFNYDRYLEHRFIRSLVARYPGINSHRAWDKIAGMFTHLYGSLGPLPEQVPDGSRDQGIPLGAPETEDVYTLGLALPKADTEIRIVHDSEDPPESFTIAGKRFKTAEQVLFLGFGFGKKNVERLQTDKIGKAVHVSCTTFGMTEAELIDSVFPAFPNHGLDELHQKGPTGTKSICLFLRERVRNLR
jgi:hypothetical protein